MKRTASKIYTYRPKAIIDGARIQQQPGTSWVAIPDKHADQTIIVIYADVQMTIKSWRKEAQMFKRFRDQYWTLGSKRPQFYTLGYFKFVPDVD